MILSLVQPWLKAILTYKKPLRKATIISSFLLQTFFLVKNRITQARQVPYADGLGLVRHDELDAAALFYKIEKYTTLHKRCVFTCFVMYFVRLY